MSATTLIAISSLTYPLQDVDRGSLNATWQKSWQEDDKMNHTQGKTTIALSAFMLSALPTDHARKVLVKEMWESGSEMIVMSLLVISSGRCSLKTWAQVLIDHNSTAGFECIAKAREYLLNVGRKESEDPATDQRDVRGSHVVAPVSLHKYIQNSGGFMNVKLVVPTRWRLPSLQSRLKPSSL